MSDSAERGGPGRRRSSTLVVPDDQTAALREAPRIRDRCTLTMLAGPAPGALFEIQTQRAFLGRAPACLVNIDDDGLSMLHAKIERLDDAFHLADQNSTNGTFLNGERVVGPRRLQDGDRIQIGAGTLLKVSLHDEFEHEAARKLWEQAVQDGLTGTYNRRFLLERLPGEHSYAARHGTPLTLILFDIDHFKRFNDEHGHLAGDRVLREVARSLQPLLRREDLLARYGGEEFVLMARGVEAQAGIVLAERIRMVIEQRAVPWEGQALNVTTSLGVATMGPERTYRSSEALLAAADEALYRAKNEGRNCVRMA